MGIPVITSYVTGCIDPVIRHKTGIFVNPADVDDLYNNMFKMHENREMYESIKCQCRNSVIERFDRKQVRQDYIMLYKHLIGTI